MKGKRWPKSVKINGKKGHSIRFVAITQLVESEDNINIKCYTLWNILDKCHMKINDKKTKPMIVRKNQTYIHPIKNN